MQKHSASEKSELIRTLNDTKRRLSEAYTEFNETLEPELIEASVFEINSLRARCAYLYRRARELGINGETLPGKLQ